jgi:hypothetical protein
MTPAPLWHIECLTPCEWKKAKDGETVSDQEIWLAVRYLDLDIDSKASDIAVILTVFAIFMVVDIVCVLLHFRGL